MNSAPSHSIVIAANPKAGAQTGENKVQALREELEQSGYDVVVASLNDVESAVAESKTAQCSPIVIAAGGDGTAAAVAGAIDAATPMFPYPLGTENLLARYLGIPADPGVVCDILHNSRTVQFDAGLANGRLFLLMASCGFDAQVVHRMDAVRQGNINHLSYLQPIYESLLSYRFPTIRVMMQDAAGDALETAEGKWAFVINLPRYAGGLQIVPQAQVSDGVLDVCVFRRGSLLYGLIYMAGVLMGAHETWPDCRVTTGTRLRIESDESVPYQIDGDLGGFLPLDVQVLPGRVCLMAPASWRQ